MKSISFKNFRRFKEFPEFNFGDITILVGGNNAGKSTLLKALILLVDNMKELKSRKDNIFDWDKPVFSFDMDHIHQLNLGTLGRALRIGSEIEEDELEFSATIGNFRITFDVGNASFDLDSPVSPVNIRIEDLKRKVLFDFDWAGRMFVSFEENNNVVPHINESLISNKTDEIEREIQDSEDLEEITRLNQELEKLKKLLTSNSPKNNQKKTETASVEIANYINLIADQDFSIPTNPLAKMVYQWIAYQLTKPGIGEWKPVDLGEDEEQSEIRPFTKDNHIGNHQVLEDKVSLLREIAFELNATLNRLNDFDEVYYIQAHSISQRVLYNIDNRNDYMAQVLHRFVRENTIEGSESDIFLKHWLKEFGIGDNYRINSIQGEGYTVEIETTREVWQHLADLGMGSNQLLTLLLELATLLKVKGNRQYPLIIVEEPEQNLHPEVQSKLANLFEELNRRRGFKFLIETHSEYLIRKTQVLVAEMNLSEQELEKQNPFRVYYFDKQKGPYDMKYLPSGRFDNKFREGFFDEASSSALTISKLERKRING